MDMRIKNRVAVVTGGSSGIGLAAVSALLEEGARVAFCGRSKERLLEAAAVLEKKFSQERLLYSVCDVLDREQIAEFRRQTIDRFGGVDILVNNAGRARFSTFADTDDEAWRDELHLKFFSIIYPTRAFLDSLEKSDQAAIVCVNSLLAVQPEPHMVATSAARAGVLSLSYSLAKEFAPKGIRVNSILLGTISSGQWKERYQKSGDVEESFDDWMQKLAVEKKIPLGRFGVPAEAASAIVYLASPLSSYTTGATLDVSGGFARHI